MFQRIVALGVKSLFGGARKGSPTLAALGAAVSIWGLFRRLSERKSKPIYTRTLKDGETVRVTQFRGRPTSVEEG